MDLPVTGLASVCRIIQNSSSLMIWAEATALLPSWSEGDNLITKFANMRSVAPIGPTVMEAQQQQKPPV